MSAAVNEQKPPAPAPAGHGERIIVYQHSDLIYWWVVWVYGFVCALLTWLGGKPVAIAGDGRPVLIYPGAWLGISFVALVLFVLVFTNARARGVKSLVLFLLLTVAGLAIEFLHGWNKLLGYFPLLLVHMNLAFYLLFSGLLLIAWLVVVLGFRSFHLLGVRAQLDCHETPLQRGEPRASPRLKCRPRGRAMTSSCTGFWGCGSSVSAPATSRSGSARPVPARTSTS